MKTQHLTLQSTGRFSQLICDYIGRDKRLASFYGLYPTLENFKDQIALKSKHFSKQTRSVLIEVLNKQYEILPHSKITLGQLELLKQENTFTITTGHQLCLMTGPLYFIIKIACTINLCKQLKAQYPKCNFVPIYWMASEDHDFEEISSFQFQDKKIQWNQKTEGAVGSLSLDDLQPVLDVFETHLGNQPEVETIKEWIKGSYRKSKDLSEATLRMVHALFGDEGLVILEPNVKELKECFKPYLEEELKGKMSYSKVLEQIGAIQNTYDKNYLPQVNPREINLFYLTPHGRYRIEKKSENYSLVGTENRFTESEMLQHVADHPERFSPNVILRPAYQEVILPNLCYIGGGGEIAYWLQLKENFDRLKIPFPMLLVRNSVLLYSQKTAKKMEKLKLTPSEIFLKRDSLINKKIRQISSVNLDLGFLKDQLKEQFDYLHTLVAQTDPSFEGAVAAQEKKQTKGVQHLEKRLLKAQKRVLSDQIQRLELLHNELFPGDQLQERSLNFTAFHIETNGQLIPLLLKSVQPLRSDFTLIEY